MYAIHFKPVLLNHGRSNSSHENLWPVTTIKNLLLFLDHKLILPHLHEPLSNPFLTINYLKDTLIKAFPHVPPARYTMENDHSCLSRTFLEN